ncbi:hypothetical protein KR059_005278 [Drosophila kikkawai]|nr:hypothetical protein KR059_005278 [Drosophila kikkawai]
MQRIIPIVAIVASFLAFVGAQICQECQADNDVYCLNQTSYQNCMKNAAFGAVETCPTGTVCSNSADVCVDSSQVDGTTVLDVCGLPASCQTCNTNKKYTCVSQTQFARCSSSGVVLSSSVYSCEEDEICIEAGLTFYNNICVPTCAADFLDMKATCSNVEFTTTTTTAAPTTTPTPEVRKTKCSEAAAASGTTAKFFYTRYMDDATCRSYLYCGLAGNDYDTVFLSCKLPKIYFDSNVGECVDTKPAECT